MLKASMSKTTAQLLKIKITVIVVPITIFRSKAMENGPSADNPLLRLKDVQKILPMSKTSIYEAIEDKKIPKPFKLGNMAFWLLSDILLFIQTYILTAEEKTLPPKKLKKGKPKSKVSQEGADAPSTAQSQPCQIKVEGELPVEQLRDRLKSYPNCKASEHAEALNLDMLTFAVTLQLTQQIYGIEISLDRLYK
jgi:predicted DNA-binding transcriptional regulator AlpA